MPNISFLTIVNYLEALSENHADVKEHFRWNVNEVTGAIRSGIELPLALIDTVETQSSGSNNTPLIHNNTTAFTVVGKPNTKTGNLDDYEAQNEVLEYCQRICFDFQNRILHDASLPRINGEKNWLYGLVDKNSFHFFKVGPLFSDGLYGYRCELTLKSKVITEVDNTKWADL
ncbi:hypothetical protein [Tenacibaculum singaporense]|uniref:hypothetical protein n=1 Tax=Tenacibaculum singaporense TaxID=2358479 RepID=UPI000F67848B|nr:hypothetical protein [Tenacibaculum singaporense]RSC96066.1 hypothetical protein EI424_02795 [Tenacibaculum singaporense]